MFQVSDGLCRFGSIHFNFGVIVQIRGNLIDRLFRMGELNHSIRRIKAAAEDVKA